MKIHLKNSTKAIGAGILAMVLTGCAGGPRKAETSWKQVSTPVLAEESNWGDLSTALQSHIKAVSSRSSELQFGSHSVGSEELARSLNWCLEEAKKSDSPHIKFLELLQEYFVSVRAFAVPSLVTGYYQPVYSARKTPQSPYTQPLYRKPSDLLVVDLEAFQKIYSGEHQRDFPKNMRLRGRVVDGRVVPYWSREDIDREGVLKGKSLEIAYVHPVDAFFLQIQGSGKLLLENKESFWVGFADQNGHPYLAVGRRLRDHLSGEQMGMEALRQHMLSLNSEELSEFLSENPSYVFFEKRNLRATGSFGLEPHAGRTVAVDPTVYALGGIGFLNFVSGSKMSSRLVFFQDTGGAIKGPRIDLFVGEGSEAGLLAGELNEKADLTVLLPSPKLLSLISKTGPSPKR